MSMKTVYASPFRVIDLGRLGENQHTKVIFDASEYLKDYPNADISILNQLPGNSVAYPVVDVTLDNMDLVWTVSNADLVSVGTGRCELVVVQDQVVVKSVIFVTRVGEALDGTGEIPDRWESWQTVFARLKDEARSAAQAVQDMGAIAETIVSGSEATVDKYVDEHGAVTLAFGIPRGDKGEPGSPGNDGYSPTVSVIDIPGGHRVTITDATGAHSFDVMDSQGGGTSDYAELDNKPAINAVTLTGNKTLSELGIAAAGDIPTKVSDLTNDAGYITDYTETDPTVPAWAKAANKPSYTAAEVGALPEDTAIPTKVSDLTNDAGYITDYTETDPTVPAWAKTVDKPSYTAAEVGALPEDTVIPSPVVTVLTPTGDAHTLRPCPVTYSFGEKAELSVTVTADTQYHFMFSCPSSVATVLTMNGITGRSGDTLAAGKTYEVDIWAGVALVKEIEVAAV